MTGSSSFVPSWISTRGREGAVLVVVVLLGLGMFALAHGLLLGARSALVMARAGARFEVARVAVDEAMDRAVRMGPGPGSDSLALRASRVHSDTTSAESPIRVRWQRLSSEIWLLEAQVEGGGRALARVARVVWAMDPVTRLDALPATVSVGAGAVVSIAGSLAAPGLAEEQEDETRRGMDASCNRWWDAWPHSASAPSTLAFTAETALGPLSLPTLRSTVVTPEGMRATPDPRVVGGVCDTSHEGNWGDPSTSESPCSTYFALVGGEGLLGMVGGYGQGVLVVDGDVELTEEARFFGVIVASGVLRVGGGAVLEGFALASGGVQVAAGGEVRRSVCRGLRALDGVRDRLPKSLPLHGALDYGPR